MKKIILIDGPNLNLLGKREPEIYGFETLDDIHKLVKSHINEKKYDIETSFFQSNSEGEIVDCIQSSSQTSDGLIINAAGFSHTSVALLDALLAIQIPKIEIHLTNLFKREDFRHHSFISKGVNGVICGFGANSYLLAVDGINKLI
ncbi:MAG: type II 3-dehydroquinate dehydratase [Candidatus Pelagibacter sp. TMED263]|nr:MAG: type II 3-dehydroquinate dehydratase [Candidatus Pelagibacter sp. TMED263]